MREADSHTAHFISVSSTVLCCCCCCFNSQRTKINLKRSLNLGPSDKDMKARRLGVCIPPCPGGAWLMRGLTLSVQRASPGVTPLFVIRTNPGNCVLGTVSSSLLLTLFL